MFADDLKIFRTVCDRNDHYELQETIEKVYQWSEKWNLKLSKEKGTVLHIGRKNLELKYFLNNEEISNSDCSKDLGILMSHDGKFSKHIREIVRKSHTLLSNF